MLEGKIIRACLSDNCKVIYRDSDINLMVIKPCKKCERATGFFESLDHFYRYIDLYGIDTDNIIDPVLRKEVCNHYNII